MYPSIGVRSTCCGGSILYIPFPCVRSVWHRIAKHQADSEAALQRKTEAEETKKNLLHKLDLHRDTMEARHADLANIKGSLDLEKEKNHQLNLRRVELDMARREVREDKGKGGGGGGWGAEQRWRDSRVVERLHAPWRQERHGPWLPGLIFPPPLVSNLRHPIYICVCVWRQVEENLRHTNDSLSLSRKEYDSLRRKVKTKRGIADAAKEVRPYPFIYRSYLSRVYGTYPSLKVVSKSESR